MKQYNGEKAIISLTSWKARINTVCKTLFSLIDQCPGFHIVLVLSEEEFPKKEDELPENLKIFIDNDLIEVLWVYKNYKAFKKWIFTAEKYPEVPIITADDDCIYTCNYAQKLYNRWISQKRKRISIRWAYYGAHPEHPSGASHLFFGINDSTIVTNLPEKVIEKSDDDGFFGKLLKSVNFPCTFCTKEQGKPFIFHNENSPLHNFKNHPAFKNCYKRK